MSTRSVPSDRSRSIFASGSPAARISSFTFLSFFIASSDQVLASFGHSCGASQDTLSGNGLWKILPNPSAW